MGEQASKWLCNPIELNPVFSGAICHLLATRPLATPEASDVGKSDVICFAIFLNLVVSLILYPEEGELWYNDKVISIWSNGYGFESWK